MKIVPYTAVLGNMDAVRKDILCFTEKDYAKFVTPVMNAKIFKVLSHMYVDSDVSIWMDANIKLRTNIESLVELLGDADIALSSHPWNDKGIWQEYENIKFGRKNKMAFVEEQIKYYGGKGFSPVCNMWCGGFIIRRHNDVVIDFNNKWWSEICRWSERDQISLPYVLSRCLNLKLNTIPFETINRLLDIQWHAPDK